MTKRKTALARYIEYLEGIKERDKIPEYAITTGKNYLNTEKQDLIDTYLEGAMDSPLNSPNDAKLYFDETFENER